MCIVLILSIRTVVPRGNKLVITVAKQKDDGTLTTMNSECDCISAGIDVGIKYRVLLTNHRWSLLVHQANNLD